MSKHRICRQRFVLAWAERAFGAAQARSLKQRSLRLAEEALEAAQATGVSEETVHELVRQVFRHPKGELSQELGGVGVCLLALAEAAEFDADACEVREIERIANKPIEHFRKRNKAKLVADDVKEAT